MNENCIKIFEQNDVRTVWDEDKEKWFISIIDVIFVLAQSKDYLTATSSPSMLTIFSLVASISTGSSSSKVST